MYYAKHINGTRVPADHAQKGKKYFCPICKEELIFKCGQIIPAYYAHKPHADCDPYYSRNAGMGPWHKQMQGMFPENCREIGVYSDDNSGEKRIADVLIGRYATNMIIEFQQSKISSNEFIERTNFYKENGRKTQFGNTHDNIVIWVFNFSKKNIYIRSDGDPGHVRAEWKGNGRVRFLNNICSSKYLRIMFYVSKNQFVGINYGIKIGNSTQPNALIEIDEEQENYKFFTGKLRRVEDLINYTTIE